MGQALHSAQTITEGIHVPYNWTYADAAARTGATGFVTADVGKLARQLDNNSLWMLTATTPTWSFIASGITGADVSLEYSGTATAYNSKLLARDVLSHGLISGGTVTDGGANTVTCAIGKALVRKSNSASADLVYVEWAEATGLSVPSGGTRYIALYWNAGSPVIQALTSYPEGLRDYVYLAECHNLGGGTMRIHNDPFRGGDLTYYLEEWIEGLIGNRISSGEVVTETGTRNIAVTAGVIWDRHMNEHDTLALDTSVSGSFDIYYRNGAGSFTRVATQTQWPNAQYDNGTGTLADLTAGYYGIIWVIRGVDGSVALQYGQGNYASQAEAESADSPATPEEYDEHGLIIAQLVFQKSASTAAIIVDTRPVIGGTSGGTGGGDGVTYPISVDKGGTGATTAAGARTNLSVSGGLQSFYWPVGTDNILLPHYVSCAAIALTNINGTAWAIPIYFEKPQTISALMLEVTTSAASSNGIKVALYNAGADRNPSSLLLDAGTVDAATTGIKTLVISQAVAKGLYWLVIRTESNSAVIRGFNSALIPNFIGTSTTNMSTFRAGIKQNVSYPIAWPDPWGVPTYASSGAMPLVGFQLSA